MAIVQISQITNRLGLNIDLPQLAGGELGWSTDTRQLYIGNGTLEQGAPVIGNTEILTEFSDILNLTAAYTYKGTAAGYVVQTGPTPGAPITQSLQNWLDQFATVKDFGAKGDGLTDDTAAINRALNQLYCQQENVQVRRSLFFPAGKYVVSGPINIPSYATLYGEGPENSIIQMIADGGTGTCVAQTADSLQQTGPNIGNGGAIPPTDINVINMAFQSLDDTKDIFLVESATNCEFRGVSFSGSGTTSTLTNASLDTSSILFSSTIVVTSDILLDGCRFTGSVYGATTVTDPGTNDQLKGIVITNSIFNTLFNGVVLGYGTLTNGGPTGFRVTNNMFDTIYNSGILFGDISLNATGYNIFYDVGNEFLGTTNPYAPVIIFLGNSVSIGDMFERTDVYAEIQPRVSLGDASTSIVTTNGSQIELGSKTVQSGLMISLSANVSALSPDTAFSVETLTTSQSFKVDYSMVRGASQFRTGTFWVSSSPFGDISWMDDYTEATATGVVLTASKVGTEVLVQYSSDAGDAGTMNYSISYFN